MANNLRLDVVCRRSGDNSAGGFVKEIALQIPVRDFTFHDRCPPRNVSVIGRRLDVASVRANQIAQQMPGLGRSARVLAAEFHGVFSPSNFVDC